MSLNPQGQPVNEGFNLKANKQRNLLALRGMLEGISADEVLRDLEVAFLHNWLTNDVKLVDDGDILDLRDLVSDILKDGVITADEIQELRDLISDVLEYGEGAGTDIDGLTNQLLGILKGVTADGILNRPEIMSIKTALDDYPDLTTRWPGDLIHQRLNDILADDVITDEEAQDLCNTLSKIVAQTFKESGLATGMATQYLCDDPSELDLVGQLVCFTGTFVSDNRSGLKRKAAEHGAIPQKSLNQKTDYLVLGTMASRDWKFTSYGRKIETVLENRKKGSSTLILSEYCWQRATRTGKYPG